MYKPTLTCEVKYAIPILNKGSIKTKLREWLDFRYDNNMDIENFIAIKTIFTLSCVLQINRYK